MKRLLLFLLAGVALFMGAYVVQSPEIFFGAPQQPPSLPSQRPAVQKALAAYAQAMADYYASGDETRAKAVLAAPDSAESPLNLWRADRAFYLAAGGAPTWRLADQEVRGITVTPDSVIATASEKWDLRLAGRAPTTSEVTLRYTLRPVSGELRVAEEALQP